MLLRQFFDFDKYKTLFTKDYQELLEDLLDYAEEEMLKVKEYEEIKKLFALYHGCDFKTCYAYLKTMLPYFRKWCISLTSFLILFVPLRHKFYSSYKTLYPEVVQSKFYPQHEKLLLLCQENLMYMLRGEESLFQARINEMKKVKNYYEVIKDNYAEPFYSSLKKLQIIDCLQYVCSVSNFYLYKKVGLINRLFEIYLDLDSITFDIQQIGFNIQKITYTRELYNLRHSLKTSSKSQLLDTLSCILANDLLVLNKDILLNKNFKLLSISKEILKQIKNNSVFSLRDINSDLDPIINQLKKADEFDEFLKDVDSNCECEGK